MLCKSLYKVFTILCCVVLPLLSCEKDKPTEQKTESFITWENTIGGADDDIGFSVIQDTDGGYIIAGATTSFGAGMTDVYIIKIDSVGDTLWTRTYGGELRDNANSVCVTSDNG